MEQEGQPREAAACTAPESQPLLCFERESAHLQAHPLFVRSPARSEQRHDIPAKECDNTTT
eukprot:12980275-Alexandrium_andersonii.AAC.1